MVSDRIPQLASCTEDDLRELAWYRKREDYVRALMSACEATECMTAEDAQRAQYWKKINDAYWSMTAWEAENRWPNVAASEVPR